MQFSKLIGQDKAKATFFQMVKDGRLPHALLLKGKRGIGKLAFATAMAQYINCEAPGPEDSCGSCASCLKIQKGIHPDVRYVLPIISKTVEGRKATSDDFFAEFRTHFFTNPYFSFRQWIETLNGMNKQVAIHIHEMRELKRKVGLKAFEGEYKVVILWNAEYINKEAANAMLKLLEEPPDKTIFLMTVTDPSRLLPTINSRCQRLQLHRIAESDIASFLEKNHQLAPAHASQVALMADGAISDALSLLGNTSQPLEELFQSWMRFCYVGKHDQLSSWVDGISKEDKEFQKLFLSFTLQKLRNTLLFSFQLGELMPMGKAEQEFQQKFSQVVSGNSVEGLSRQIEDSLYYLSRNANAQMVFTVLSLRIHALMRGRVMV